MPALQTLIQNVQIADGTGGEMRIGDVGISGDTIIFPGPGASASTVVDGDGHTLAPGFIDVHTHDDLVAIRQPEMLPKLSQGVTTSIVGNCGISAAPVTLRGNLPDPMNLLGSFGEFCYPTFSEYVVASGGYPGNIQKGLPIEIGPLPEEVKPFHAGTAMKDGQLVTNGGRVIADVADLPNRVSSFQPIGSRSPPIPTPTHGTEHFR